MSKFIFILGFLYVNLASAQVACWKSELNYKTNKIYVSQKVYQAHLKHWMGFNKANPNPYFLSQAYLTYKNEIKKTQKFSSDKVKHCYMGCRIAAETNLETAEYTAWNKEKDDLTDCKVRTHFELVDYQSTVDGAKNAGVSAHCEQYCLATW
jgi:hypothetical protein